MTIYVGSWMEHNLPLSSAPRIQYNATPRIMSNLRWFWVSLGGGQKR